MHEPNSWSPSCQVIGRASGWRGILPVDHRAACERTLTGIVRVISTHRDVPPPTRQDGSTRNNLLCWFGRKHQLATLLTRRDFLDVPPPTRQDGATRNKVAGAAAVAAAAEVHQASRHLLVSDLPCFASAAELKASLFLLGLSRDDAGSFFLAAAAACSAARTDQPTNTTNQPAKQAAHRGYRGGCVLGAVAFYLFFAGFFGLN
jgi:hypothetical protein